VVTAATTFATTLFNAGLHTKISRLNLYSGDDLKAALVPLFYQPSTKGNDSVLAGSFSYSLTAGVTNINNNAYMSSNQKISRVDQNDGTSWPADGSNVHMSMFFMNPPPSCRNMGVWRESVYTRHYLLMDLGALGWGSQGNGNNPSSPGLYTATSDVTKESTIGTTPAVLVHCPSTGSCSTVGTGNGDGSTPSDWPVGMWASLGSGVGCANAGDTFYTAGGALATCSVGGSIAPWSICAGGMRVGGYSVGYKLTVAEIQTLRDAFLQYFNVIGRV
jgi:hypothetical protein